MVKAFGFQQYGGVDVQEFLDLDMPTPLPDEVRAAAVNPVDWKIRAGYLAQVMPRALPAVLGSEVSGVVRGVGKTSPTSRSATRFSAPSRLVPAGSPSSR